MENLPVEVIGNVLSRLKAARDVVIASTTCRKWQEAWRKHLHALSFDSHDWSGYHDLTTSRLEILITQTIFQTQGLQSLSISMEDVDEFSAAPVIAWLIYTRDNVQRLCYNVRTKPKINILEKCGRQKLEALSLSHTSISGVEPSYQKFPCLRSLSLSYVSISALDLSLLLNICPRIESLSLIDPDFFVSDSHGTMELNSPSLREIHIEVISLDTFILEADRLESLNLRDCTLDCFELVGKGTLKALKIDDTSVFRLDIGDSTDNLEVVDISHFPILWSKFYHRISKSANLRKLRLWGVVVFDDEIEIMDLETISACFPRLTHLSLSYELREMILHYGLQGSSLLENVTVLELGWTVISSLFADWVAGFLGRCPRLKKLVIYGVVSDAKNKDEYRMLAKFTTSIIQLMRKYTWVEIQFEYE